MDGELLTVDQDSHPMKRTLVALTGAGISAESGLATFRDTDGLWEGHRVEDVATVEGWTKNPAKVLEFYNERRKKALEARPNRGHQILAELEQDFDVTVITQNVDNLHERAGSSRVMHLHGSLFESRSTVHEELIYPINGWALNLGDRCEKGFQLRPNIVWFGERVPLIGYASEVAAKADIFLIIGTSMLVYPAAGLIHDVAANTPKYIVDPRVPDVARLPNLHFIAEKASTGMEQVRKLLTKGG